MGQRELRILQNMGKPHAPFSGPSTSQSPATAGHHKTGSGCSRCCKSSAFLLLLGKSERNDLDLETIKKLSSSLAKIVRYPLSLLKRLTDGQKSHKVKGLSVKSPFPRVASGSQNKKKKTPTLP
jgi:hypothetical protein